MALTKIQRLYGLNRSKGVTPKLAAIAAGVSAKTASQTASRLEKHPNVKAHVARLKKAAATRKKNGTDSKKQNLKSTKKSEPVEPVEAGISGVTETYDEPEDFLRAVMNDAMEDTKLRIDAAVKLQTIVNPNSLKKPEKLGKKEQQAVAAVEAAKHGRFGQSEPPKLKAV